MIWTCRRDVNGTMSALLDTYFVSSPGLLNTQFSDAVTVLVDALSSRVPFVPSVKDEPDWFGRYSLGVVYHVNQRS